MVSGRDVQWYLSARNNDQYIGDLPQPKDANHNDRHRNQAPQNWREDDLLQIE